MLRKPSWAPPSYLFAPVWTVLYVPIAISFGTVFWMAGWGQLPLIVALPFALNLVFNLSFTYFQFKLQSNTLAAIDVVLTLLTLIWAMVAIYPYLGWLALINVPYLLWVAFATALQLTVTYLNR